MIRSPTQENAMAIRGRTAPPGDELPDLDHGEPTNNWVLSYEGFDPDREGLREALCTLGNGYFATRGAAPEPRADGVHYPGTYVAGCYDRLVTDVAGRTVENEDIVNMPNWLPLTFRIDGGDWFDLRRLDLLVGHRAVEGRAQLDRPRPVLALEGGLQRGQVRLRHVDEPPLGHPAGGIARSHDAREHPAA
jgi:Glycosyl hydrolase family 65, N-terminal domain